MNETIEIDRPTFAAMLKAVNGNLKKMSVPPALSNRRSREEWAGLITADFNRSVEGIIAAGRHLKEAQDELDHGDWLPLLKDIGINERTAQRFMKIAANPVLANPTHWVGFPTFWRTLSELATLPTDILEAKIADGTITPRTTRADVAALKGKPRQARPKKGAAQAALSQGEIAVPYDIGRRCELEERIAELESDLETERETARARERELQRENDLLRSEVKALRAELEGRAASQPNGTPVREIELLTDEDRQRFERAGQQRLPLDHMDRKPTAEAVS